MFCVCIYLLMYLISLVHIFMWKMASQNEILVMLTFWQVKMWFSTLLNPKLWKYNFSMQRIAA